MTRKIAILGATGSIGKSTLDLVEREARPIRSCCGHCGDERRCPGGHCDAHACQASRYCRRRRSPVLTGTARWFRLSRTAGDDALLEAATADVDLVIAAIVGCAGLRPVMAAVDAGRTVALANKEALVTAGALMIDAASASGATLLPDRQRT